MPNLFPIHLLLDGRRVLVVGGGHVALRKVELLLDAGAKVIVVSPEIDAELAALPVELNRRPFEPGDVAGCMIVIAATDDPEVNRSVIDESHSRGILVNVVDQPPLCDFYVPASVRRGRLCVAISTGGASPGLARRIRKKLEEQFPPAYGEFIDLLGEIRPTVLRLIPDEADRKQLLARLASDDLLEILKREGVDAAREAMIKLIDEEAG